MPWIRWLLLQYLRSNSHRHMLWRMFVCVFSTVESWMCKKHFFSILFLLVWKFKIQMSIEEKVIYKLLFGWCMNQRTRKTKNSRIRHDLRLNNVIEVEIRCNVRFIYDYNSELEYFFMPWPYKQNRTEHKVKPHECYLKYSTHSAQ